MNAKRRFVPAIILASFVGFVAGVTVMAAVFSRATRTSAASRPVDDCGQPTFATQPSQPPGLTAGPMDAVDRRAEPPVPPGAPVASGHPAPASTPSPTPTPSAVPELSADPLGDLKGRDLRVPVSGVPASALVRSFADKRSGNRVHEAIDILAPRSTPVLAVEDGVLVKFFHSKAGGNTIYQFDPTRTYAYYYAHLDRYAAGI